MPEVTKRPVGLVAIVVYKAFSALLLAIVSIALFLAVKHYPEIIAFSEEYTLEGKLEIIKWFLNKILRFNPQTLQFTAIAVSLYSAVTAIEAVGLWYQKFWAKLLVLVLVSISIPPEIFEIIQGVSILNVAVFLVNLAVFSYLLSHSLSSQGTREKNRGNSLQK